MLPADPSFDRSGDSRPNQDGTQHGHRKSNAMLNRRRLATQLQRLALCGTVTLASGCGLLNKIKPGPNDTTATYHDSHGMQIEYPEVQACATAPTQAAQAATQPLVLQDPSALPALEMTLQEAIQLAVQQSPILRTVGGTIVSQPGTSATVFDPALTSASPTLGTEAALSAFDAQLTQKLFWTKTDQPNNVDRGGFTAAFTPSALQATGATYSGEISKQTAVGSKFALRHIVNYDRNNQPFRQFKSDFNGYLEAEVRHPLMQGNGTLYNRIAGPNAQVGQYNGVLIARTNEDIALADFENAMIGLVADVEQAYWDLATAYRILDATVKGREAAQQTFQYQEVRLEVGSGRLDEEAQARSQFYQFQAQVESALGGTTGLYALEQNLRYLVGLAATDGRLIKPISQPTDARVVFDWDSALGQALYRRVELRRQKLNVKKREMELVAARMNRQPRLDFLGQYRWRGLGDHLIGDTDNGEFDNLYDSITDGNYQEWQAGLEMDFPVGLRAASVAVSHAKLNLSRERAVLAESELRISHDLSNAARDTTLTHKLLETNYNRYLADLNQVEVLQRRYLDQADNINFLLQAQRQVVTSETEFYRSLQKYNLAIRDFHRQKGSLLAYNQVQLAEGPWAAGAARDAAHVGRFLTPHSDPSSISRPAPISSGIFNPSEVQSTSAVGHSETIVVPVEPTKSTETPLKDAASGSKDQEAIPNAPQSSFDNLKAEKPVPGKTPTAAPAQKPLRKAPSKAEDQELSVPKSILGRARDGLLGR